MKFTIHYRNGIKEQCKELVDFFSLAFAIKCFESVDFEILKIEFETLANCIIYKEEGFYKRKLFVGDLKSCIDKFPNFKNVYLELPNFETLDKNEINFLSRYLK